MKLFSSGRPANGVPAVAVVGLALLGVAGPPGMAPCLGAQDVEQWTVEAPPDLVIGEAEGDEAYLFMNVLDATTLSDGRVAIVEFYRGFFEVRWFDPQGRHMASAGRWGPGSVRVQINTQRRHQARRRLPVHCEPGLSIRCLRAQRKAGTFREAATDSRCSPPCASQ